MVPFTCRFPSFDNHWWAIIETGETPSLGKPSDKEGFPGKEKAPRTS